MTAKYSVCSIPIATVDYAAATREILAAAGDRRSLEVHLCNAYTLSLVDRDERLMSALQRADMNIPDGTPVARLGRAHGVRGPVRGPRLVEHVFNSSGRELSHFLYGARPGVAEEMAKRLTTRYPKAVIAGIESPPFRELTDAEVADLAERVRNSGADVVWIGLGTPRQDYFVPRLAPLVNRPVLPVGAAFDFHAGMVDEAPGWMHGSGLEWVFRLTREPRRLWHRYLVGNPRFVISAVRHRWSKKTGAH